MIRFTIYTPATAADSARTTLAAITETTGFLPNIYAVLGHVPNVLDALVSMNAQFANGRLTAIECEIVQLAVSVHNGCGYCVAGHSAFAAAHGMAEADLTALRTDRPLGDPKHEALRRFAQRLAAGRGRDAQTEWERLLTVGYTQEQTLDVILGVAAKMFTNTLATLSAPPLDDRFKPYSWIRDQARPVAAIA